MGIIKQEYELNVFLLNTTHELLAVDVPLRIGFDFVEVTLKNVCEDIA